MRGERLARPMVAVDTVLFAIRDGRLQTYLVELRRGPSRGKWAFAGGLVRWFAERGCTLEAHNFQADLASRSTSGELRHAEKAGHMVNFDQPEAIVDAIRDVGTRVNAKHSSPPAAR